MHYSNIADLPYPPPNKTGWPWLYGKAPVFDPNLETKWPKISIVTPCYNHGEFIEETIRSVLLQGYPNLEYIIIDGGSSDNSVAIIKKYQPWLAYWVSEPEQGEYNAINKGFSRLSGDIMAWINSSDMYYPSAFRTVSEIFSQLPLVNWICSWNPTAWDRFGLPCYYKSPPGYSRNSFYRQALFSPEGTPLVRIGWLQQESTFWRRSLWEKVSGLDEHFSMAGDFDLWARFFLHEPIYGYQGLLGGFRFHDNCKSNNVKDYVNEAWLSFQRMNLTIKRRSLFTV